MTLSEIKWGLIAPTLKEIGLYSDTALNLVTGTGLVESGYRATHQVGGGPALGWFQMEPVTHDDIWRNYLVYRPELGKRLRSILGASQNTGSWPSVQLIQTNHAYAAAMCRIKYLRSPKPLPIHQTAFNLCQYWKNIYNTPSGKGLVDAAHVSLFQAAINDQATIMDA